MPSIKDASATSTRVMNRLPCAHSTIISEKALPTPVVITTLMTRPMATSNKAVMIVPFTPSTQASKHSCHFIGVGDNHEATMQAKMAKTADRIAV